jgi:arylsulfatase
MTTRRDFVRFLSAGAAGSRLAAAAGKRPNILFLMNDELRSDCVGYVNPVVKTPNLDKLAGESVVFTNAYSTSPSCVPARAAIYTGRYPSQCGAPTYITYLPSSETTFMARLQSAGYYTAAVGKQHFGDTDIRRGYDYEDLIDPDRPGAESASYVKFLRDAGFQNQAKLRSPAGRFVFRWTQDQRFHVDDYVGEQAKRWFRDKRPKDKPWFLTVSFHGPHQPFDGLGLKQEKLYRLSDINMPATNSSHLGDKPPHFAALKPSPALTEEEIRRIRLSYYSKISMIDEKIGGIIDALKVTGEYDNTLIVFAADHGDYMGDFGLVYKGQYLSEVLMRVPMLAKPPMAAYKGRRENAFVNNFDIAATSLVLAGLEVPAEMTAQDLSPFWRGPATAKRRPYCFMDGHTLRGVRDQRWKLVHYEDRPYGELYDLQNDPWEKKNLWSDPSTRAIKAELQNHLIDHLIHAGRRSQAEWNRNAPKI